MEANARVAVDLVFETVKTGRGDALLMASLVNEESMAGSQQMNGSPQIRSLIDTVRKNYEACSDKNLKGSSTR